MPKRVAFDRGVDGHSPDRVSLALEALVGGLEMPQDNLRRL